MPAYWGGRKVKDYLVRLREVQSMILRATQDYLKKKQKIIRLQVGHFFLLQYPRKPTDTPSVLYHGLMEIVAINRPDIVKVRHVTTNKVSSVHTSLLRIFRHPAEMSKEELKVLSAMDLDEYYIEKIVAQEQKGEIPKNWTFNVRWVGYEPEEDSWLNWTASTDLLR